MSGDPAYTPKMRANLLILALGVLQASALAQVVQYADRTTYNLNTSGNSITTFEGLGYTSGPATGTPFPTGVTIAGVTYLGINNSEVEIIEGTNVGSPGNTVLTTTSTQGLAPRLKISLANGGATAFAFDVRYPFNQGPISQINLFDSNNASLGTFVLPASTINGTFNFIGFTSSTQIAYVTIGNTGLTNTDAVLDNVTVGNFAPVPEPASLCILALGSGFMVRRRVRKMSRPSADASSH